MWHYFYAHAAYHMSRWFPQGDRDKMSFFLMILSGLMLIPQIYVITLDTSSRHCEQPLLSLSVASIVFSIFTVGFTILFCIMIPVPTAVKIAFHVFGLGDLILGLMLIVNTYWARVDCFNSTYELFILCLCGSWLSGATIVFFVIVFPFWIINVIWKDSVLEPYSRSGICYEPTRCGSCIWHI